MIDALNELMGRAYAPIVDPVTGQIAQGFAGVDWSYVLGCAFSFIGVWLFFGVLLAIFRRK